MSMRRQLAGSVEGTSQADLRTGDWGQLAGAAAVFGSAFLWIAIALRTINPGTIAFGRVALGAATLGLFPAARCAIRRPDWARLVIASTFGFATPVLLFALAEEHIPSAVAGMLVSGIPIFTATFAALETRTWPRPRRLAGLGVGFGGIVLLSLPNLAGGEGEVIGVAMVVGAVASYALATTLYAPLQQTYGSLRVTMWLLIVSSVILAPLGILGFGESSFELSTVAALAFLGIVGTGAVWAVFVGLVGRVGAVRAAIVGYLIPIMALLLGVVVLGERVAPIQVAGVAVSLAGGYLLSRAERLPGQVTADALHGDPDSPLQICR